MRTVLAAIAAVALVSPMHAAPPAYFGDATLRGMQFVDSQEGWAVGDDGVIWHTIDGGTTWERQPTGVRASLRAVHFLNPYTGWVVGREELPAGASRGVILATTDGGLKWTPIAVNALPGLNCVRFFNERVGVAAGDGSDSFPTGLFATQDGGRTWRAIPGQRCPSWFAADFTDPDNGSLGGAWSRLAPLRNGLFGVADYDPLLGGRSVRGLKLDGERAYAVGEGGLVMRSTSGGIRWGFCEVTKSRELLAALDFHALAVRGQHVWVVGRPGSVVFHSPDGGNTWETQHTGQTLPLHSIQFISDTQGWAVGELGTILSTRDGGKNWKVEKVAAHSGQRAAVLFVHASGRSTPLDTVAILGHEGGYLTAAIGVTSADPASAHPSRATDPERLAAAMRATGGITAEGLWQFPAPSFSEGATIEDYLGAWDRLHGDNSAEYLLRQLVLALRIWRPEVVITDAVPADAAEALVVEGLKEAFKQAGDASAFAEQIDKLGLAPWGAKKLYVGSIKPDPTAVHVDMAQASARLGDAPREFAYQSARLFANNPHKPLARDYRLLATRIKDASTHSGLMDGIELAHGGNARRALPPISKDDEQEQTVIRKAVEAERNLETIARTDGSPLAKPEESLAHIGEAVKDFPADMGARAMLAVGMQYARLGQWQLAREVFLLMADRYPVHPLTADAYRWLIRYHSSSEARRRDELGHFMIASRASVRTAPAEEESSRKLPPKSELLVDRQLMLLSNLPAARKWYRGSLAIEPRLAAYGPMCARDVPMQLCWQSAARQLGEVEAAQKWITRYLADTAVPNGAQEQAPGSDPWRDCVLTESWLTNRTSAPLPPKPIGTARQTASRPHLDGKLDDACWAGIRPLPLKTCAGSPGEAYTAQARFAYDAEFLYVGVECTHPEGKHVARVTKRSRDAELRSYDRVQILIDLDRDYQTYFRFQVDQRGCLAEDCWGDVSWNPRWFVALASEETSWTAEIAIPLVELTGEGMTPGRVWACNVTRVIPGKGLQTWSGPADAEPRPEGMGLLQFVSDAKR